MAKFHIGRGGKAAACSARKGKCPYGSDEEHFSSREAAKVAAEERLAKSNGVLSSSKKTSTPVTKKANPKKIIKTKTSKPKKNPGIAEDGYKKYDLDLKYNPNVNVEEQIKKVQYEIERKYGTEESLYEEYKYQVAFHGNRYNKPAVQKAEKKYYVVLHAKQYAESEIKLQKFMHENGKRMKELKHIQDTESGDKRYDATSELSELRREMWNIEDERNYNSLETNLAKAYLDDSIDNRAYVELVSVEYLRAIQTRKQRIHDIGGVDAYMLDPYDEYAEPGLNASYDLESATYSIRRLKPDWSDEQLFNYIDKTTNVGNKIELPK